MQPCVSTQTTMFPFYPYISLLLFFLVLLLPCSTTRPTPRFRSKPPNVTTVKDQNTTLHEFKRFLNAEREAHVAGISNLKRYFHRFGYIPMKETNFTNTFDSQLQYAINHYQANLGLPMTGKLDLDTLTQIMSPRCGVPDTWHATRHYAFFTGQPRWARNIPITLTYAFLPENVIGSLSLLEIRGAFKRAFARWASVVPVTFKETSDYGFSDIKIGFYSGDHGDGEPFDGVLGVLAHTFSPESGRLHLDAAETWTVDFGSEKSIVAVDLESVATHEIGHVLGLAHSSVKEAIMYPSLRPRTKKLDLMVDDITAIQALYGSNPNFKFSSSLESDMSSNQAVDSRVTSSEWATFMLVLIWYMYM